MIVVDMVCMIQHTLILGSEFYENHVFQKFKSFTLASHFTKKKKNQISDLYPELLNNLSLSGWLHK